MIIEVDMVYAVRPTDGDDDEYFPEPIQNKKQRLCAANTNTNTVSFGYNTQ
jgi:hypothetical protein